MTAITDRLLSANNKSAHLNNDVAPGDVSLVLAAGEGSGFPSPVAGQYAVVTVQNLVTGVLEIMHCTARTGDILSVERAKEGTAAIAFPAADSIVQLRVTSGVLAKHIQKHFDATASGRYLRVQSDGEVLPEPGVGGAFYIGQNLGTGADVYKETDNEADPRVHKFRSLVSSNNSVSITELPDSIDFSVIGGGSAAQPGTNYVGSKKLICGTSVSYTPASDTPAAAPGDLALLFVQPRIGFMTDYYNALAKPPTGWSVFVPSAWQIGGTTYHAQGLPAIFYKFLTDADINTTHTSTEANSRVDWLCGAVMVYRGVNPLRPFGAKVCNFGESLVAEHPSWGGALPIYSTQQHVICLWNQTSYGAGDGFTAGTSAADWPLYDPVSMPDFTEIKFGVTGLGGDSVSRVNSVATWGATIQNDENLVPYENSAQSITTGVWASSEMTVGARPPGSKYTTLVPTAVNAAHYVEWEREFAAGDKITFAPFIYASYGGTCGYWLAVVSPDATVRARLYGHYASSPGWRTETLEDPLGDHGTVWLTKTYCNEADGVPHADVAASPLYMIAPQTGTYKFRIYVQPNLSTDSATKTWAARIGSGGTGIATSHVLVRRGHHTPTRVPTGASPIINSGASFSTPTRGWANTGAFAHLAFALNPAWEDDRTPLARMSGICNPYSAPEGDFIGDGTNLERWYGPYTDSYSTFTAEQPIFPFVDGVAQKYYLEVEFQTDFGSTSVFGTHSRLSVGFANAYTGPPSSAALSSQVPYGMFYSKRPDMYDAVFARVIDNAATLEVSFAAGDVLGCEVDFNGLTVKYFKNSTLIQTTTIRNGFPDAGVESADAILNARMPWYFTAAITGAAAKIGVRLRTPWLQGPSGSGFLPYDYTGSAVVSAWNALVPSVGGGAEIVYVDPGTGVTQARSVTGGEGIQVTQYDETVDVALKIDELTTQTPDINNDYTLFFDASTGGASKALVRTLLDINSLPIDGSPDAGNDYVPTYDFSAGTNKKVLISALTGGGGGVSESTLRPYIGRTLYPVAPTTPDPIDDEFLSPLDTTTKWTVRAGSAANCTSTPYGMRFHTDTLLITQPISGTSWQITSRLLIQTLNADGQAMCLIVGRAATNRCIYLAGYYRASGYPFFYSAEMPLTVGWTATVGTAYNGTPPWLNHAAMMNFRVNFASNLLTWTIAGGGAPECYRSPGGGGSANVNTYLGGAPDCVGLFHTSTAVGLVEFFRRTG